MSPRTIFLSRLLGVYYILVTLSTIIRKQFMVAWATELTHNPAGMFLAGVVTLAIGLAIVVAHNIWSGGALPVIVTLLGWTTVVKSLLFLFLPPEMEAELFLDRLHYADLFYFYMAISLALGIYLTYAGFASGRRA
jgi:hypothetical protein